MTTVDPRPNAAGGSATDDVEHLRLLSIFHYVVAALVALMSLFPAIHLVLGFLMITGHLAAEDDNSHVVGWVMAGCAFVIVLVGLGWAATIAYAGRSLAERRRYTSCLVVAAVLSLFFPFGTVLGVLTIVVLVRPSVKELFSPSPRTSP